jgi:hypothetical protein
LAEARRGVSHVCLITHQASLVFWQGFSSSKTEKTLIPGTFQVSAEAVLVNFHLAKASHAQSKLRGGEIPLALDRKGNYMSTATCQINPVNFFLFIAFSNLCPHFFLTNSNGIFYLLISTSCLSYAFLIFPPIFHLSFDIVCGIFYCAK